MNSGRLKHIIYILSLAVFFTACSTKKNTFVSRNYHNLTSYYNVYWNGNEAFKDGIKKLQSAGIDNYSSVLNVIEYGTMKDTTLIATEMNRSIEKASKCIKKHSIIIKGKEHVLYIDDAYILMGKSYVYMHKMSTARTVFNYITSQFAKQPPQYEAALWIAKTYIIEEEYDLALPQIAAVKAHSGELSQQTKEELPLVEADFYVRQKLYDQAIQPLKNAITLTKHRDTKSRLEFILAQIYQNKGDINQAYDLYRDVTKRRAPLEMDFNARLNMALCYDSRKGSSAEIVKEMNKLLKDSKNSKSFGRIYYVLSEVARRDKNIPLSIEYLEKSVDASSEDKEQLVISSVKLGDYYYAKPDYKLAHKYYAIAAQDIDNDNPDYYKVTSRTDNLNDLVHYLDVIDAQKQILKLALMSKEEQDTYIKNEIKKYQEEERKRAKASAAKKKTTASSSATSQGSWYFYNSQAKIFGYNEFVRKWGKRKLEDNWFLTNKPEAITFQSSSSDNDSTNTGKSAKKILTPNDPEYYANQIPASKDAIADSAKILEDAMFQAGLIYVDKLDEKKLAATMFENMLKQFPNSTYKVEIYYHLYRTFYALNDHANMKKYSELLLTEYPASEQAQRISDPDFLKKQQQSYKSAEEIYEYTFFAYSNSTYDAVLRNIAEVEKKYPSNSLMPQFKFLEAASLGALEGPEALITYLNTYITAYPSQKALIEIANKMIVAAEPLAAQSKKAANAIPQETDNAKSEQTAEKSDDTKQETPKIAFIPNNNVTHSFLMVFSPAGTDSSILKTRFTDFNRRNFNKDNLLIEIIQINEKQSAFCIKTFKTSEQAMQYYNEAVKSAYLFGSNNKDRIGLVISDKNLEELLNIKHIEEYQKFFEQQYLQK